MRTVSRVSAAVAVLAAAVVSPVTAAVAAPAVPTLAVTGAVATPSSYSPASLAALPQRTSPVTSHAVPGRSATGVDLEDLVLAARPTVDPAVKNGLLRVRVTATGADGRAVSVALGELDPSFGNHPALLVTAVDGRPLPRVTFAFPGDATPLRTVRDVRTLTVAVGTPPEPLPAPVDGVVITQPGRSVTVPTSVLRRLPQTTTWASYLAGSTPQTHVETGPQLAFVLLAAGVVPTLRTAVTAVGDDGYLATVTPGESLSGARALLLALAEDGATLSRPRLVAAGDVKGGRYVSGVVALTTTR